MIKRKFSGTNQIGMETRRLLWNADSNLANMDQCTAPMRMLFAIHSYTGWLLSKFSLESLVFAKPNQCSKPHTTFAIECPKCGPECCCFDRFSGVNDKPKWCFVAEVPLHHTHKVWLRPVKSSVHFLHGLKQLCGAVQFLKPHANCVNNAQQRN